jgi:hypothetical protein
MVESADIYAHLANDGAAYCSYSVDYETIENLESPAETQSTLEYIEAQFFQSEGADEYIDNQLEPEGILLLPPPKVGELRYDDGEITDLEFDFDEGENRHW